MLLSILIPGKNDNFRVNNSKTLELNLQQTLSNINKLNKNDIEVILCDWGSDEKITNSVFMGKHKNFKCVYVPPEIASKYSNGFNYSIVHPINTSFRKSTGKYVIFWDSDCFVMYDDFKKLYEFVNKMNKENDMSFYWGSRYNIPYDAYHKMKLCDELSSQLINDRSILSHDKIGNADTFIGCSISLLMNRELWQNSTGWYEKLIHWGWQDREFHNRLRTRYKYGGDLEDFGINFYHMQSPPGNSGSMLTNQFLNASNFEANPPSWGLNDEILEII